MLLIHSTESVLPRPVGALLSLRKKGDIKGQLYCIH